MEPLLGKRKREQLEQRSPSSTPSSENKKLCTNPGDEKFTTPRAVMVPGPSRDAITNNNSLNSPLLRLPGELRNKIYEYALSGSVIKVNYPLHTSKVYKSERDEDPQYISRLFSLKYVCRQTYTETGLLAYKLNMFYFKSAALVRHLSECLSREQLQCFTSIAVGNEWAVRLVAHHGVMVDNEVWLTNARTCLNEWHRIYTSRVLPLPGLDKVECLVMDTWVLREMEVGKVRLDERVRMRYLEGDSLSGDLDRRVFKVVFSEVHEV